MNEYCKGSSELGRVLLYINGERCACNVYSQCLTVDNELIPDPTTQQKDSEAIWTLFSVFCIAIVGTCLLGKLLKW